MKLSPRVFARDRRGNFAMMMSLMAVPLVLAVGVALDFTSMSRLKARLQQAMDSAALAVAREGTRLSNDQAMTIAGDFITENFDPNYTNLVVEREGTGVTVKAATRAPLAFGNLFGYQDWPISAASSADIAYTNYEIALVLDTTGSMKGGKLASLKDAVGGLVETMSAQVNDTDKLKFAVVPFANFVNVGPEFAPKFDAKGKMIKGSGAPWLDLEGKTKIPQLELAGVNRFEVFHNLHEDWRGCVETRVPGKTGAHDTADTPASKKDVASLFVPALSIDEPEEPGYANDYIASDVDPLDKTGKGKGKKLKKYGAPNGLIEEVVGLVGGLLGGDDDDDDDDDDGGTSDTAWLPVQVDSSGGKGPNQACVTQPIMPLNSDYKGILSKVATLQANGNTNIMEGVAWGMRVLSPEEPFSEGMAKGKQQVDKIMIVLTDGANVFGNNGTDLGSSYSSHGFLVDGRLGIAAGNSGETNARMNAKTLEACTFAKEGGVEIYTIRLEEPDVATGTMLQECATTPAHYFDAPSRNQLDEVFEKINERIVRIRISS